MTFDGLILLFPIVLGIHNLDEYSRYDEFIAIYHRRLSRRITDRRVIRAAAVLLTGAAAVIVLLTYLYGTPTLHLISRVAVFALTLNALGHCGLSILRRKLVPGTRSAIALVFPYSAVAIYTMHSNLGDSAAALGWYGLLGALATPFIVLVALAGGVAWTHLVSATRIRAT